MADIDHDWFIPEFIGYECCRRCGIVRRADRMNGPCRGTVSVGPRETDDPAVKWRDCFAEITAKATPFRFDETDPERIVAYLIPAGPLHRACGVTGFQFWGGEEAARQWQQRAEAAEAAIDQIVPWLGSIMFNGSVEERECGAAIKCVQDSIEARTVRLPVSPDRGGHDG